MPDLNRESLEIWNSLKPMVDEEIKSQTRGAVQRRKAKVTTAPSLSTNKIGVTEPYCAEIFIPFVSNLISATVGDYVWIEFAYGATNAYASMFASSDHKDETVAGNLDVMGNVSVGGNITMGTIDASVVTIDNINASNISYGTLSADRIAAGSLAIGKLDSAAQNTINGANSQEQLIYRSKGSGTTSLSGTTTWVTNTTGNQDTWTLKRPTYNSSYPVLFIATQRKDVGGTVTCTTPQIDNTTTVIDGGHITTGTIDASVVSVTNLNASNISSGTLSAARIGAGSITANKLDSADINASKILTVGSMTDAAAATVLNSNIAIGGRNLCTGTAVSNEFTKSPNGNWFAPVGAWPISTYGGAAFADTANTQWTASFDYSITGVDAAFTLYISPKTSESTYSGGIAVASIPVGSSSGHAEGTGTITDGARAYAGTSGVLFLGMGNTNANAVLTVSNLKVEIGNKATSWTQAPEDVAADIATAQSTAEGANSQEQLIYRSKTVGTTSISGTTTWVTNTNGNQDTWTIKRPKYNTSYPVMFIATQRKTVGGTVTCTTPQIDDTITVIDGGNIITGTVTANQIAGGTITSTNLATALNNTINTAYSNASDALSNAATAQSTAESANSQEQLIYISKASGTTTQAATTTWVTDTNGNQNTWTIKRPTYNSSYPVLFVATQRKSVGGTVTCTTPQIDNTTTVIDGGHITTGTIDASVVSVTNLNASNITSGTMSASKISGGTLTLGGSSNTNGTMTVMDANGVTAATVNNNGITINGSTSKTVLDGGLVKIQNASVSEQNVALEYVPISGTSPAGYIQKMYTPSSGARTVSEGFWWYIGNKAVAEIYSAGDSVANCDDFVGLGAGWTPISGSAKFVIDELRSSDIEAKNLSVYGVLDVTNRHTSAVSLSTLGWYRAIKIATGIWRGGRSCAVDICIGRVYNGTNNEIHRITLLVNYDSFEFVNETSKSNTKIISAIRYTHDSNSGYIDIQYTSLSENNVYVDFDVHCHPESMANFTAQSLQSVADSPSGETVLKTYNFAANTKDHEAATKDENFSASTFELSVYRRGDILLYAWNINVPALTAATYYNMGSFSKILPPSAFAITHAGQGTGQFLITFQDTGNVRIYSNNATSAQFCRGRIAIPAN